MKFSTTEQQALIRGAAAIGVDLDAERAVRLGRYVEHLYAWNRNIGLTTIARVDAPRLHILDSLAALPLLAGSPCIDLGTGAGLPGMVLAIASPSTEFVLVESNRRRCSFLLDARRQLGLSNVQVVEGDADQLDPDHRYPCVISRAFRPPPEFLVTARRMVTADGRVVLMMADPSDDELRALADGSGFALELVHRFLLPGGGEPRTILRFAPSA